MGIVPCTFPLDYPTDQFVTKTNLTIGPGAYGYNPFHLWLKHVGPMDERVLLKSSIRDLFCNVVNTGELYFATSPLLNGISLAFRPQSQL